MSAGSLDGNERLARTAGALRVGEPWEIKRSKRAMTTVIPRFNMRRVLFDYTQGLYQPAARQYRRLAAQGFSGACQLAEPPRAPTAPRVPPSLTPSAPELPEGAAPAMSVAAANTPCQLG